MSPKVVLTDTFHTQVRAWGISYDLYVRLLTMIVESLLSMPREHMRPTRRKDIFWVTFSLNDPEDKLAFHTFNLAVQFSRRWTRARVLTARYFPPPPRATEGG